MSSFTIAPVTLADRMEISNIIARANFDDPYGQLVWPGSTIEGRMAGSYARLAKTLTSPNNYLVKAVDENGTAVGYSQWTFPKRIWEGLMEGNPLKDVGDEERAKYAKQAADSCVSPGWPKGLRREVVETLEPGMEAASAIVFPEGMEKIDLNQVKVLPEYQRRGVGSALLAWGVEIADRECLKIGLEATPFGKGLYGKFGFQNRMEVHHDLAKWGMPEGYTHTFMIREPRKK